MADSNRANISFEEEVAWGGGATGGNLTYFNFTSESLAFNIENITSDTIRTDRQVADLIQTGADCSGDINFELQYGGCDWVLQGGLWAAQWVGADDGATDDTITSAANPNDFTTIVGNTITFTTAGDIGSLTEGQWIYFDCPDANEGHYRITDITGAVVTVDPAFTVADTYDAVTVANIISSYVQNGTTENSYYIERNHTDVTEIFRFEGMTPNTLNLNFAANTIANGTIGFIGETVTLNAASAGGGYTAASTNSFMNCVSHIGEIRVNGTAITSCLIQEISLSINNNVRGLSRIGNLGFCDVGVGECMIEGTLNMYFLDSTYYDLYLAGTSFQLDWRVTEGSNTYVFTLPECKFISDTVNVGSKNSDVMENTTFQAYRDPTLGFSIMVSKYAAP